MFSLEKIKSFIVNKNLKKIKNLMPKNRKNKLGKFGALYLITNIFIGGEYEYAKRFFY